MATHFEAIKFSREGYNDYQERVGQFLEGGVSLLSEDEDREVYMTPEIVGLLGIECNYSGGIPTDDDSNPWRVSDVIRRADGKVFAKLTASHNLASDKDYDYDGVIEVSSESVSALVRIVDPNGMEAVTDRIRAEADARRVAGEEKDPIIAMNEAISSGEDVPLEERRLILEAHCKGPWMVNSPEKMDIFRKWCARCGIPIGVSKETLTVFGETVYVGDKGDCVLAEAAKGNVWALWTRPEKGRIQIGFRDEKTARKFRAVLPEWSQEATNNKRPAYFILEGLDDAQKRAAEVERIALVLRTMWVMMTR